MKRPLIDIRALMPAPLLDRLRPHYVVVHRTLSSWGVLGRADRRRAAEAAIQELSWRTDFLRQEIERLQAVNARLEMLVEDQAAARAADAALRIEVANLRNLSEWTHNRVGEISVETANRLAAIEAGRAPPDTGR